MPSPAKILFMPFDEYLELEAKSDTKHEWINGLIYAMSRGTPEHGRLSAAIVRALPQTAERRVYSSDTLLYIEKAQHSTYADASIVCGAILTRGAKDKNGKSLGEAITNPRVVVRCCPGRPNNETATSASRCFSSSTLSKNTSSCLKTNDGSRFAGARGATGVRRPESPARPSRSTVSTSPSMRSTPEFSRSAGIRARARDDLARVRADPWIGLTDRIRTVDRDVASGFHSGAA